MKRQGHVKEVLPLSDSVIKEYINAGECTLALEALMQQHQDAILRYCYCHLLDEDIAQEVAQEVFVTAFEKLSCLRNDASVNAWLYGIATNKCLERQRNRSRRETLLRDNQALIEQQAHCTPQPSVEDLYILEGQRRLVWQALQRLRIYERELVILRYLEGLIYDDIAHIMKVSSRTVERHLPQALSKFFKAYERCERHARKR